MKMNDVIKVVHKHEYVCIIFCDVTCRIIPRYCGLAKDIPNNFMTLYGDKNVRKLASGFDSDWGELDGDFLYSGLFIELSEENNGSKDREGKTGDN